MIRSYCSVLKICPFILCKDFYHFLQMPLLKQQMYRTQDVVMDTQMDRQQIMDVNTEEGVSGTVGKMHRPNGVNIWTEEAILALIAQYARGHCAAQSSTQSATESGSHSATESGSHRAAEKSSRSAPTVDAQGVNIGRNISATKILRFIHRQYVAKCALAPTARHTLHREHRSTSFVYIFVDLSEGHTLLTLSLNVHRLVAEGRPIFLKRRRKIWRMMKKKKKKKKKKEKTKLKMIIPKIDKSFQTKSLYLKDVN